MDLFKRIGALASYLDNELHRIEATYRIVLESGRVYEDGLAAEVVDDVRAEISQLNKSLDELILVGETQHDHFQSFITEMVLTLEKFDEKINSVENYALRYGYVKNSKEKADLRKLLENVEEKIPNEKIDQNISKQEDKVSHADSPNLLHMGISKQTLKSLGFTLNCQDEPHNVDVKEPEKIKLEEKPDDSSPEESRPVPILKKKNKSKSKLNASAFDHSQVEISPGLFVKRPSSKTKGETKKVNPKETHQSPFLPNNGARDCKAEKMSQEIIPSANSNMSSHNLDDSPQLPDLKTTDLNKILNLKKVKSQDSPVSEENLKSVRQIEVGNSQNSCSPELPSLKTIDLAKFLKDAKEEPIDQEKPLTDDGHKKHQIQSQIELEVPSAVPRIIVSDHEDCGSPELPDLKTINLAKIFKQPVNLNEQNKENEKKGTPELPILNSHEANVMLSHKKVSMQANKSPMKNKDLETPMNLNSDSPELPNLKTINLASILREKGTLL